jgi:hypothetical protein
MIFGLPPDGYLHLFLSERGEIVTTIRTAGIKRWSGPNCAGKAAFRGRY